MIGKMVEHPFDTIKVRLQTQTMMQQPSPSTASSTIGTDKAIRKLFQGPFDCFRKTVRMEGVKGLYQGLPSPLLGAMMENAVLFLTYNQITDFIRQTSASSSSKEGGDVLGLSQMAMAGALSGAFVSTILTPVELIKCQVQVQQLRTGLYTTNNGMTSTKATTATTTASSGGASKKKKKEPGSKRFYTAPSPARQATTTLAAYPTLSWTNSFFTRLFYNQPSPKPASSTSSAVRQRGALSMLVHVVRESGVRGLYRGFTWTLLRESGGGAAWFGVYEATCRLMLNHALIFGSSKGWDPMQPGWVEDKRQLQPWQLMLAGGLAGIAFNGVLFPADVVKSIYQTRSISELKQLEDTMRLRDQKMYGEKTNARAWLLNRSRVWRGLVGEVYRRSGWRGFYQGLGITLTRAIPSNAVIFLTYEMLSRHLE